MTLRQRIVFAAVFAPSLACASAAHDTGASVYRDAAVIFGSAFTASIAGFAFAAISGAFLFHFGSAPQHMVMVLPPGTL